MINSPQKTPVSVVNIDSLPLATPYGNKVTFIEQQWLDNGLLPYGAKPLPEPMLTRDYWHPSQAKYATKSLIEINFYASALGQWVKEQMTTIAGEYTVNFWL